MLELDRFIDPSGRVRHGFLTRVGGVSQGAYASLNVDGRSADDPVAVAENRRRAAGLFGLSSDCLSTLDQVHGAQCHVVERALRWEDRVPGDAQVTDRPGILLGVLTADCAPVLLRGDKADGSPVIGAAHAGWQGALHGVLESTVTAMTDLGARLYGIVAAVGPCIGAASYEVSEGFADPFLVRAPEDERFFRAGKVPGKLFFDLPGYVAARLSACGVRTVILSDADTLADENRFFSYRRSTLCGEGPCGRQLSGIVIQG